MNDNLYLFDVDLNRGFNAEDWTREFNAAGNWAEDSVVKASLGDLMLKAGVWYKCSRRDWRI